QLGVSAPVIADGLSHAPAVPGRFQPVDAGQPFAVVVDYAHTPDGLEHVLHAARETPRGRVPLVFGCRARRDRTERAPMGEAATRLADVAVLTSDNPRSEDPDAIIAEVEKGAIGPGELIVEPDRRAAIRIAIGRAAPGDVVVIAGKGHEKGQVIGATTL